MKRVLGLVFIVVVFFLAMNFFGSKEKIEFKGAKIESLKKIAANGYSLKGELQFYNPSSFSSQLGSINVKIFVNKQFTGEIEQNFSERISSKNDFNFPFEIRFTNEEIVLNAEKNEIEISGKSAPNSVLFNYEIPVEEEVVISTEYATK